MAKKDYKKESEKKEIKNPLNDVCYWGVIDYESERVHYFATLEDAQEFASWHDIPEINIFKENDN